MIGVQILILSEQFISLLFHLTSKITDIDQKESQKQNSPWPVPKAPSCLFSPRRAGSDAGIKKTDESTNDEKEWQPPSAFIKGLGKQIKRFTQMVKRQQEEQEAQSLAHQDEDEYRINMTRPSQILPEQCLSAIDERELDNQFLMPDDDPLRRLSLVLTG
jgi:hypothetical protein